jgi:hypothetical protein
MSYIIIALIIFAISLGALLSLFILKARALRDLSVEELNRMQPSVALIVYKKILHLGHRLSLAIWKRLSPHVDVTKRAILLALSRAILWLVRKLSALRDNLRGQAPITHRESTSVFLQDLSAQSSKNNNQGAIHG